MKSNYSRKERQKIVEEYIQSGKSQTVFAPEYDKVVQEKKI
jgi:transposase-like protein